MVRNNEGIKKMRMLTPIMAVACLAIQALSFAAYAQERVDTQSIPSPVYMIYDTNRNGFLEWTEIDAMKAAYRKDLNSKMLKLYDRSPKDDELSTDEIMTIPARTTIAISLPSMTGPVSMNTLQGGHVGRSLTGGSIDSKGFVSGSSGGGHRRGHRRRR
jgi:hypothetical protein